MVQILSFDLQLHVTTVLSLKVRSPHTPPHHPFTLFCITFLTPVPSRPTIPDRSTFCSNAWLVISF